MENTLAVRSTALPERVDAEEERAWLAAARAGEPWALERFFRANAAQVHALCSRMLGRQDDAEDAVQAAFVRAFHALARFRGDSSLRTWIYRIAVNECISVLRRRRETGPIPESVATESESGAVVVRESVATALGCLGPDQRAILVLRYWEEMDCEEIAQVLGISLSAVKMRLHRARAEFKKRYDGEL
jgi:RNA polymerase sigma-70 factor (ECF subfamily)